MIEAIVTSTNNDYTFVNIGVIGLASIPADQRCQEHHDKLPYSSEHLWHSDPRRPGLPVGSCQHCGEPYLAYHERVGREIEPLLAEYLVHPVETHDHV